MFRYYCRDINCQLVCYFFQDAKLRFFDKKIPELREFNYQKTVFFWFLVFGCRLLVFGIIAR